MKQKMIITFALLMLLTIIGLMVWDFYYQSKSDGNPYVYEMDNLRSIDKKEICYRKANEFPAQINGAYGIAIDQNDQVYLAGKNKIKIMNNEGVLKLEIEIGEQAFCIAVDCDGNIYLGLKNHIEVFDSTGTLLMQWPQINDMAQITCIAVEAESVFVADAGNKIVYHYDNSGILMNTIGERNKEEGFQGFIVPSPHFDLTIGREGQLWVVNPGKHEFLAFNKDGSLFSNWSRTSMQLDGFSGCCNPGNIALLPDGSFITSEKGIERVKIHHPSGDYKCVVATPDDFMQGVTHLDLAVNSMEQIFVLDTKKGTVNIFDKIIH